MTTSRKARGERELVEMVAALVVFHNLCEKDAVFIWSRMKRKGYRPPFVAQAIHRAQRIIDVARSTAPVSKLEAADLNMIAEAGPWRAASEWAECYSSQADAPTEAGAALARHANRIGRRQK